MHNMYEKDGVDDMCADEKWALNQVERGVFSWGALIARKPAAWCFQKSAATNTVRQ